MVAIIFLLGLAVGSFLNAWIYRMYNAEALPPALRRQGLPLSVWRGRSYCPKCKKPLSWYELIPLVSFLIQLGRCRGCKQKIDWQYPLVELATGVLFLLALPRTGQPSAWQWAILTWYLLSALVVLFVYDLRYGLVPDKVVLPAIVVAFLYNVIASGAKQSHNQGIATSTSGGLAMTVGWALLAIAIGAGFFALQYYLSRGRWLGAGDIRIGALMGAMAGWPFIVEALVISYLIGGAFAGILLILGKKRFGQTLPLGTFLTLSTAVVFLYGQQIWQWYWR